MTVDRKLDAYYYSFAPTGVEAIDRILSAVACAGSSSHHTDGWQDITGPCGDLPGFSPVEWIQNAANEAAAAYESAKPKEGLKFGSRLTVEGVEAVVVPVAPRDRECASVRDAMSVGNDLTIRKWWRAMLSAAGDGS